jgi:hypothetical protein
VGPKVSVNATIEDREKRREHSFSCQTWKPSSTARISCLTSDWFVSPGAPGSNN